MATEMTGMTKIGQNLMVLHQRRATGELIITSVQKSSPVWKLYFYLGRIVYATGGVHPVRRWYRAFKRHCPAVYKSDWLAQARSTQELWEVDLLNQALDEGLIAPHQVKALVRSIVAEVMFAVLGQKTLNSKWYSTKPIAQTTALLSVEQELQAAYQLRREWQSSGLGYLQELLSQFSPDLSPTLKNISKLETVLPADACKNMTRMVQGQRTLWDVALHLNRPLPLLVAGMLPLVRQGIIELKEIADLPAPYHPPAATRESSFVPTDAELPIAVEPTAEQTPGKAVVKPLIACVDNNSISSQMIAQILQPLGYEVLTILNPLCGIATLLDRRPSLIFLDAAMPSTNGYELCTFLRKTTAFQSTPIVILVGQDGVFDRVRARLVGSSDSLTKPLEAHKVLQVVQKFLGPKADKTLPPELVLAQ
jgi:two-component system, chemotaxis family, response regulator PixG